MSGPGTAPEFEARHLGFLAQQAEAVISWAAAEAAGRVFATTAFGSNGTVLLHFLRRLPEVPVYFLDTGHHFPEVLALKDRYKGMGFKIVEVLPAVGAEGVGLHRESCDLCCDLNKVEPMRRLMEEKAGHAWITGLSRDQGSTRRDLVFAQRLEGGMLKVNPLMTWSERDIWGFIRLHDLPYNMLYDRGYRSIGCAPCTTPTAEGEDARAGRWRGTGRQECGLHTKL